MIELTDEIRLMRRMAREMAAVRQAARDAAYVAEQSAEKAQSEADAAVAALVRAECASIIASDALVLALGTTGVHVGAGEHDDQVCEIVLMGADRSIVYQQLCKPTVDIDTGASACHGHTADSLKDASEFAAVAEGYRKAVGGRRLVAWSADFEQRALAGDAKRAGIDPDSLPAPHKEDDSVQDIVGVLTGESYARHGASDRTPKGVAEAIWARIEEMAGKLEPEDDAARWAGADEEDFDDIPF